MRTLLAAAFVAVMLAGCAAGPGGNDPRERFYRSLAPRANPSAVIAAELAFAREAREEGQWTAFREFATDDAVMFVPERVNAKEWLSGRADPPQSVDWQPHQVWASCDGSLSVTRGAWQRPDGSVGYFTTVWQRRDLRREAEYRWVLDQGDVLAEPLEKPDIIRTDVADCASDGPPNAFVSAQADWDANLNASGAIGGSGRSADGTLAYRYSVAADRSRTITVFLRRGDAMEEVLRSEVAAPVES